MSKREEIFQITYLLFAKHGFGLSLAQVTGQLGLKKQSIYNYFDSKEQLIKEMLEMKISEYYDGLNQVLHTTTDLTPDARLDEVMRFAVMYFMDDNHLRLRRWVGLCNIHEGMDGISDLVSEYEALFFERLRIIINECKDMGLTQETVDDVLVTFLIVLRGMIDGVFVFRKGHDAEVLLEDMLIKFWKMIS